MPQQNYKFQVAHCFRIKLIIISFIFFSIFTKLLFPGEGINYFIPLILTIGVMLGFKQNYIVNSNGLFFTVGFGTRNHLLSLGYFEAKVVKGFEALFSSLSFTSRQLIYHSHGQKHKINLLVSQENYNKICYILIKENNIKAEELIYEK